MATLRFLLEKEFLQISRNPFIPRMIVLFPLAVMLILPWVTTMDIRHVGVAIVDNDHSQASRRVASKIAASEYFTLQRVGDDYPTALREVEAGVTDAVLELPDGFERDLAEGRLPRISISANGVNALKAGIGSQYLAQTALGTLVELRAEQGFAVPEPRVTVQNRYNPTLNFRHFMVPGLMIMLLVLLCGFLPALNLVGEKETGTIEQINVTPVGRVTFTLAKVIPYWLIGLGVLSLAMLVAWPVYGLIPVGSIGGIYLAAVLFIFTMSGLGAIIANYSTTMQQTMFVMFFFVMIFMLMCGLFTPIESMPGWAQQITLFIPPRYFVEAMRDIYLKGTTIAELWSCYAALALYAVGLNLWAALSYRKQS